ncbi:MAG: response regulator [Sphingomonadales bacterium]
MHEPMITVIVADQHVGFRRSIRLALKDVSEISIIGMPESIPALLELLSKEQPDVILLDLTIPRSKGIKTLSHIRQLAPEARILLLRYYLDSSLMEAIQKAGADGCLSSATDASELQHAIITAVSKGSFFSEFEGQAEAAADFTPLTINPLRALATLTQREVTVLQMICQEQSTRAIASFMSMSPRTIESIRDRIKIKTGSRNIAGMVVFALKYGLIRFD